MIGNPIHSVVTVVYKSLAYCLIFNVVKSIFYFYYIRKKPYNPAYLIWLIMYYDMFI